MAILIASIERQAAPGMGCGKAEIHPFHLGSDLRIARQEAETIYRRGGIASVALKEGINGRIVDVFDGDWQSDLETEFWKDR